MTEIYRLGGVYAVAALALGTPYMANPKITAKASRLHSMRRSPFPVFL